MKSVKVLSIINSIQSGFQNIRTVIEDSPPGESKSRLLYPYAAAGTTVFSGLAAE